jgi:hypothetical protein
MDQLSEAFMCKKEFSVYFIFTLSLKFLLFLGYDALRICFLTLLVHVLGQCTVYICMAFTVFQRNAWRMLGLLKEQLNKNYN